MKYLTFAALLLFSVSSSAFATDVCGTVSGVWDLAGSPYNIICDVTVEDGQALEIDPGVHVLFTGHYKLNVNGQLLAIGTEQDSIVFTRAFPTEESRGWSVRFWFSNSANQMEYCVVEYGRAEGGSYDNTGGGVSAVGSDLTLNRCTLRYNSAMEWTGGAIYLDGGSTVISHCLIADNQAWRAGGIDCWHATATIDNCTIVRNSSTFNGGGMEVGASSIMATNTIISNSTGTGIFFKPEGSPYGTYRYCDFFDNSRGSFGGNTPQFLGDVDRQNTNGDPCDRFSNIYLDPNFQNLELCDVHLVHPSPCINSGDPNSPRDPDESIADMGVFSFIPSGRLCGMVRVHTTAAPLSGVKVCASGSNDTTLTGPDGRYTCYFEPGIYTITYRKVNFCDSTVTGVVILDTTQTNRDVRMVAPSALVNVTSISLESPSGQSASSEFTIQNQTGNCPLGFTITDTSAWLTTDPPFGQVDPGESQVVTVTCSGVLLPPGSDRQTTIVVHHNAIGDHITIPVEFVVFSDVTLNDPVLPTEFALHPNFPNPFNATTSLNFDLPRECLVNLTIFSVTGRLVAIPVSGRYPAGRHSIHYSATDLPSGMYVVRLEADKFSASTKMILLK